MLLDFSHVNYVVIIAIFQGLFIYYFWFCEQFSQLAIFLDHVALLIFLKVLSFVIWFIW